MTQTGIREEATIPGWKSSVLEVRLDPGAGTRVGIISSSPVRSGAFPSLSQRGRSKHTVLSLSIHYGCDGFPPQQTEIQPAPKHSRVEQKWGGGVM